MSPLNDADSQSQSDPDSDSDAITNACQELQEVELEVLLAIYTSSSVVHQPPRLDLGLKRSISITIQIDLISPLRLKCCHPLLPACPDLLQPGNTAFEQPESLELRFLPPFILTATLPAAYPLRLPPLLDIDCDWATPADRLRALKSLAGFWRFGVPETDTVADGDQCLSLCVDWLEHDWIKPSLPPDILLQYSTPVQGPLTVEHFISHDRDMREKFFQNQYFRCGICLEDRPGSRCMRLASCGHVFCQGCLKDFFILMIQEGNVQKVACCDQSCAKGLQNPGSATLASRGSISDGELESLVGSELKQRYDTLVEKQLIESDFTLCYCPMKSCNALVRPDKTAVGTSSESLRECGRCGFSFCFSCKKTWHGSVNKCAVPYLEAIATAYLSANSESQAAMEFQHGRTRLLRVVKEYLEDRANETWKANHTTPCVKCMIPVERESGCNHMICPKCQTHFCFTCGVKLDPQSPYSHYSQIGSQCYNQLVELDQEEQLEEDMRLAELLAAELAYT